MFASASWKSLWVVIAVLAVVCEGVQARRRHQHRGRRRGSSSAADAGLPDPSLLLVPTIRRKMQRRGMIYHDLDPDHRWVVQRINHSQYQMYCPEVVYATVVLERDPPVHYHRTCDSQHLWSRDQPRIFCTPAVNHSNLCEPQKAYHIVRVQGRERYQETFTGCVCSASTAWTAD